MESLFKISLFGQASGKVFIELVLQYGLFLTLLLHEEVQIGIYSHIPFTQARLHTIFRSHSEFFK